MDNSFFVIDPLVKTALKNNHPVVALETAVVTHGLPYPENIHLAAAVESEITGAGATPATIGILEGKVHIGLHQEQLLELARDQDRQKITSQNFAITLNKKQSGGTTVAGTLIAARITGIKVFSTGGIGGVHRGNNHDISADLIELYKSPIIVVCSGAKAILDLPATLEILETLGIPILGYQTHEFPAFYSRESGFKVNTSISDVEEIVKISTQHWQLGSNSAIIVANPPPKGFNLPFKEVDRVIQTALREAEEQAIRGPDTTPFLLKRVAEITRGESMKVNLALLTDNARLAARIACALADLIR